MFDLDPLQQDKQVRRLIERNARSRIEKKIIEDQKEKGVNYIKHINSLSDLVRDDGLRALNCSYEEPGFKQTIEKKAGLASHNQDKKSLFKSPIMKIDLDLEADKGKDDNKDNNYFKDKDNCDGKNRNRNRKCNNRIDKEKDNNNILIRNYFALSLPQESSLD